MIARLKSLTLDNAMLYFSIVSGLILLGLGAACVADAQALPAASGPGSNITVGGGYSMFEADYGQRAIGGGFAFIDVHPHWRYGFEGETRYLRMHAAENVTETTYVGGVHVYMRPGTFRPYAKFLAGLGRLNFPFHYAQGNYLALVPGAGVDFLVTDRITVRAVDFEYQEWPQFTYGNLRPYGINAGISFRLNPLRRFPRH